MRVRLITIISAANASTAPPALAATESGGTDGTLMLWGFFGFLALMVVSLTIPAILSFREAIKTGKAEAPEACIVDVSAEEPESTVHREH